jgi:putative flippase GtrA
MSPLWSRLPATAAAMVFTWLANRHITFRTAGRAAAPVALRYAVVAIVTGLFNYALYSAFVLAGLLPLLAIVAATVVQTVFGFFGYRRFAFNDPAAKSRTPPAA